jgi:hypothetical protein
MSLDAWLDSWGFVAHRAFDDGAMAGIIAQTFGKFRVVLLARGAADSYDDGW